MNKQKTSAAYKKMIWGAAAAVLLGIGYLFFYQPRAAEADWYATGGTWAYRKQITIDRTKVAATQSNFPVLFSRTDPDLKFTGFGGKVASSTAGDIVFTASDGSTKLDYEIEKYSSTTGELVAWVEVPTLSSTADTIMYVYYGNSASSNLQNPSGVWNSNFKGVWHLGDNPAVTCRASKHFCDSTSNLQDGTANGSMTLANRATGAIGHALSLDGSDDYVRVADDAVLESSVKTISLWFKTTELVNTPLIAKEQITPSFPGYQINLHWNGSGEEDGVIGVYHGAVGGAWTPASIGPGRLGNNEWHSLVTTHDGSATLIYLDGVLVRSNTESVSTANGDPLDFGRDPFSDKKFFGLLDEIRISDIARPVEWIQAEYANQSNPAAFYAVGAEFSQPRANQINNNGAVSTTTAGVRVGARGTPTEGTSWYSTGGSWSYRKKMTIDHEKVKATTTFTNFPVLIKRTDNDFKFTGFGGKVASSTAGDIVFTASDGSTKLDHDIDLYASTTGELSAWVETPSLSSTTDTVIYMYFGSDTTTYQPNPTGVWGSSYGVVAHLNELSGNYSDATGNGNAGTPTGATAGSPGKIGYAVNFDGANDSVNFGSGASIDAYARFTWSMWVQLDSVAVSNGFAGKDGFATTWGFRSTNGDDDLRFDYDGTPDGVWAWNDIPVFDAQWLHVAFSYDSTSSANDPALYFNGSLIPVSTDGSTVSPTSDASRSLFIGNDLSNSLDFDGRIDEFRYSNVIRPAEWIQTEFLNQSSPESFVAVGGLEARTRTNSAGASSTPVKVRGGVRFR